MISNIKRDIPTFCTVFDHSNWSSLRRKYLSKILTAIKALSCRGQKHKRFLEFRTPFPMHDIRENPRSNVHACAAGDDAICSKNRKIVPYHGANPNTRNGARLRSPSPIMAPVIIHSKYFPVSDWLKPHAQCTLTSCCSPNLERIFAILNQLRQNCSPPKIMEPMTSK